jgi:effector-binding domain-containing protein
VCVEAAFDLLAAPALVDVAPFRFAHARVRGPYVPWMRVSTLDRVAEELEMAGVDRAGPAFGIYYDLPYSVRESDEWVADLGYPVAPGAAVPPSLRVDEVSALPAAGLSYRGDLASFPAALQLLVEWSARRGLDLRGPLLERFHVSDALTGVEERDVLVALRPIG